MSNFRKKVQLSLIPIAAAAAIASASAVYAEDCNNNGVDDPQDLALGTSVDCNTNAVPDECELAGKDCDLNGTPDDCQADLDGDQTIDACDDCGLLLADTNNIERWGSRTSSTSNGKVMWVDDNESIYFFNGTLKTLVQVKDPNEASLDSVETSVFALGSGATDGEVIGGWRRGTDFGWVWSNNGSPPQLVDYVNPYDPNVAMNPEGVAVADGCLFMVFQAFDPDTVRLIKHVYKIDVTNGASTLLTGDFLNDVANEGDGAWSTNIRTSGCRAAWMWCSAGDNGSCQDGALQLHYYDGTSVSVIDTHAMLYSFDNGRIIYGKEVGGILQLFLFDTNLVNPAPQQITSFSSDDKRIAFAQSDGRHVAILLADENGNNREIQWLGGYRLTDDSSRPSDQPFSFDFPLQIDRGQVLWDDLDGSFRIFDGSAIGTLCHGGWLADGFVAMLRKSEGTGADVDVFLKTLSPPSGATQPPAPYAIEANATANGEITLNWEPILGATSYNVYFARESGITKTNFNFLEGGASESGFTVNTATISHLAGNAPWFFVITAVQDTEEGPSSHEVSELACVDPAADRDNDMMPDCVDDDPDHGPSNDNNSNDNSSSDNTNDNSSNDNNSNDNVSNDNSANDNTPGGNDPPTNDGVGDCGTGLCGSGTQFMLTLSLVSLGFMRRAARRNSRFTTIRYSCIFALVLAAHFGMACDAVPDIDNGNNNNNNYSNENTATWNNRDGLTLTSEVMTLVVSPEVTPSNLTLTLSPIEAGEFLPDGVPAVAGFDVGGIFGPSGTTFSAPVRVTAKLSTPTFLDTLPVLLMDEATGTWGWAGTNATVENDGITASFELSHFSAYRFWNPPPPAGDLEIEDDEIISGTGFFEGQPFNTFPSPESADASLVYSPFGSAFGLSIVQTDLTNPATGDFFTLIAGLHASQVGDVGKAKVGIVTPAGGLSGASAFVDGVSPAKGISGIMFLRKTATHWLVDVYCAYEGGILFGQATGER